PHRRRRPPGGARLPEAAPRPLRRRHGRERTELLHASRRAVRVRGRCRHCPGAVPRRAQERRDRGGARRARRRGRARRRQGPDRRARRRVPRLRRDDARPPGAPTRRSPAARRARLLAAVERRRIYLMRHGAVAYFDRDGRPVAPDDVPLTAEGRGQAAAAAALLEGTTLDRVISSDLPRAVETAALVAPRRDVEAWPELREIA